MPLVSPGIEIKSEPERPSVSLKNWGAWLGRGSLAITDQGLFAISNFMLNVLLARWLDPASYGAFAMVYSVFLLLLVFHNALFTGPMLIFGSGKYHDRMPEYLGILLRGHFLLVLPGVALLGIAAILFGSLYSLEVERAFLALAIGGPFILLLWLLRRAFYVRLNPGWAAAGGGVYFFFLVTSALTLHAVGYLTPATGILAMAVASLIACALFLLLLRPTLETDPSSIREVTADHWRYGKWVVAAAGPAWIMDNIYFLVLPAWVSLAEAGGLRALLNLAQPALQSIAALSALLLPILVRDRSFGGPSAMKQTMKISLSLFLAGCTCYLLLLWGFRSAIFNLLYANKYASYATWPLLLTGILPFVQSLSNVVGAVLSAHERPDMNFWSSTGSSIVAITFGIPLAYALGVAGALIGLIVSYTAMGILMVLFLMRFDLQKERIIQK